jgi:hypothetical protein
MAKTDKTATASKPAAEPVRPSNEAIARRAYELFLQRGSDSGYEVEDWLQAEAELTAAAATAHATTKKR